MKLDELLSVISPIKVIGNTSINITGINIDSRKLSKGNLFIAVCGTQTDGHKFIPNALEKGASAIVCEHLPSDIKEAVTYIQIEKTETIVGILAAHFYNNSTSSKLKLIGVTGTNGKTTIATLLFELFKKLGYKCGLCSTVCNYINNTPYPTNQTTPDPITLNQLLGKMADSGCEYAFMEVSSHAIHQHRIAGLHFKGGIFTNLTRDHLDYHKTFENYRDTKKTFFDNLPPDAFALTNIDDRNGLIMVQNSKALIKTYSLYKMADFHARIMEMSFAGMELLLNETDIHVPLIGKFNASNILAIYGAAILLGQKQQDILKALSTLRSVAGRFEAFPSPKGYTSIVDYAHTPDALTNVLSTILEILGKKGRVITVCGCGGNRDKGKRPQMAKEAVKASNQVFFTSDNPRFENPEDILNDMMNGITIEQKSKVTTITDRKQAIMTACITAQKGDVILIAGKGHENYQEIKGIKHHFDDREIIQEIYHTEAEALK